MAATRTQSVLDKDSAATLQLPAFVLATGISHAPDEGAAVAEALSQIRAKVQRLSMAVVYLTADYDAARVAAAFKASEPGVPHIGGTQSTGLFSERGWEARPDGKRTLGIFGIHDEAGFYAVAAAPLNTKGVADPAMARELARKAGASAMRDIVRCTPEGVGKPNGLWLMTEMDSEEGVIQGIADIMLATNRKMCDIGGGSSGNSDGSEPGRQIANGQAYANSVVVAVLHSTAKISSDFGNGHKPTDVSGIVTRSCGRVIHEIDGRPAADVYNEWTRGVLNGVEPGQAILDKIALCPLGRVKMYATNGQPEYLLLTPLLITPDRGLHVLAEVMPGERICVMKGSRETMLNDLKSMAVRMVGKKDAGEFHGLLMAWCVVYTMCIKDQFPAIASELGKIFRNRPWMGASTFGEQGTFCNVEGLTAHGNLMVSSLAFRGRRQLTQEVTTEPPVPPIGAVALGLFAWPLAKQMCQKDSAAFALAKEITTEFVTKKLAQIRACVVNDEESFFSQPNDMRILFACPNALDMINMVLDMQNVTMNLPLPEAILKLTECSEVKGESGTLLYRGPRVSLTLHYGRPLTTFNHVHNKVVYSGQAIDDLCQLHAVTPIGVTLCTKALCTEAAASMSTFLERDVPLDQAVQGLTLASPRATSALPTRLSATDDVRELICTHLIERTKVKPF
jgi:hypothetical protein